ncbi:MAG TPA: FG-GAP-like repeat-containing protein, partial [Bryobacteraceae bacterium]|nr:FG-GAP-like repeat-containing protein [Bryobacteraceae bacterium]
MLLSAGPCFITARQPGAGIYDAASASQGFEITAPKPSGTLRLGQSFGSSHTLSLIEADFNRDGITDIASASHEGTVTILLGDGSGGFRAAGDPISFGTSIQALASGDFDGDGNPDLAVATGADQVAVFLGNGAGGFTSAQGSPFAAGKAPRSIAIADFNGDGKEDLAIANFAGGITILQANGAGGFSEAPGSPFAAGAGTSAVVAADFNGDGLVDLAAANSSDGTVTILLGSQSGAFRPAAGSPVTVGMLPQSLVVADFNRDGLEDLATANRGNGTVTVLLGNGSGGFIAAPGSPLAAGLSLQSVAAGDLDGDGIVDLIASGNSAGVTVFPGDGTGGFRAPAAFGSPLNSVFSVVGDFNGDGISDLAAANFLNGGVTILSGEMSDTIAMLHAASSGPVAPGSSLSLILDLSNGAPAFSSPTGTVTFSDGTRVLGTASENASPFLFTIPSLTAGAHTITARYSGDAHTLAISASMTITAGNSSAARPQLIAHTTSSSLSSVT